MMSRIENPITNSSHGLPTYTFQTKNLKRNFWEQLKSSNAGYSVHLPDYISSTKLIDPLANKNSVTYTKSLKIINQCMIFAQEIEDKTSKTHST